jgi:two-component system, chemotaxis family, protein-glutamate methylesterase/glutaminase
VPKLRALVVDDAVVMRRLVTEVLERDGSIEVAAVAANGRIALQKLTQVNPDFITLDVEMPELDGIATLRELRKTHPRLPVIMLSLATQRGAIATLDALAAGANDYVTKPIDVAHLGESIERLSAELLPKVRVHCRGESGAARLPAFVPAAPAVPRHRRAVVDFVCIGTSTGGPNALAELFLGLTRALPVPVAIVQHMPPMFTAMLAERLNTSASALRCHEARDGDLFEPGCALLAPGGRHMTVGRSAQGRLVARLTDAPPENSCRPAVDVLFRDAAEVVGGGVLGVVMTGMGHDGRRGAERIHEVGGHIIAQDEATSVVWGMPGSVVAAGLADIVLPLSEIAAEITRRVCGGAA